MNLFYLDRDLRLCAEYHNDRHVVKMILEYAQLMSTAHRVINPGKCNQKLYNLTHQNHPSAVWVRQSHQHYDMLYEMWRYLCEEYTFRYFKTHATDTLLKRVLSNPPRGTPSGCFVDPPQCMPPEYQRDDVVDGYRAYYMGAKRDLAQWTLRGRPEWYE